MHKTLKIIAIILLAFTSKADALNRCEIFWAGESSTTHGEDRYNSVLGLAVRNPPLGYSIEPWIDNDECFLNYKGRAVTQWNTDYGSCDLYENKGSETYFDCFSYYDAYYIIIQLGVNHISRLAQEHEGNVDRAVSDTIAFVQKIQALGKKVIWITIYPMDKDGLKDGKPYTIPELLPEGAGDFGQGKTYCTGAMKPVDCRKYWNSNHEYFIDAFRPWCEANEVGFIDVFQHIRDSYGDDNTDDFIEAYSGDGMHIEYPGSDIIYTYIRSRLKTILISDLDNDRITDCNDNCPDVINPNQKDKDDDRIGDLCDYCPSDSYNDRDGDAICGDVDNCQLDYNPHQEDTYPPQGNGIGDVCDCEGDFNCDGSVDGIDAKIFKRNKLKSMLLNNSCTNENQCNGDFDCNGKIDEEDERLFQSDLDRSQHNNPCPPCKMADWCVYP